jgi:hypothetical protein
MVPAPINNGSRRLIKDEMIRRPVGLSLRIKGKNIEKAKWKKAHTARNAVEWDVRSLRRADANPLRDKSALAPFGRF